MKRLLWSCILVVALVGPAMAFDNEASMMEYNRRANDWKAFELQQQSQRNTQEQWRRRANDPTIPTYCRNAWKALFDKRCY